MERVLMSSVLVLISFCTGFDGRSQAAALSPPTVQVKVGDNITLQCPLLVNASSSVSWYRKWSGRRPQLLLTVATPTNSSDVTHSARVLVAADGSLRLRRVDFSDSAVYYCAVNDDSLKMMSKLRSPGRH
ncbi:signal-regulatory protein beta-2-like isoform X2 [Solea senegalensis]|uniref:Signal-regulatory protein beta-2-like isoform X2 n=1 Tax=Solea senegalensis TaxID=28829 RepID=A0AAV6SCG0_SOLSE|nr:secreted immunoglobulin domain 1 [Solea senegalensis]KAG7514545.1 signal-regulatory protein beta-2-like isoform X2 [Solea senegalensis]